MLQATLFDEAAVPTLAPLAPSRRALDATAWIDVHPGWLTGGHEVLDTLVREVDWVAERRQMYDRVVDVPRLTRFYAEGEPLPHDIVRQAGAALTEHYRDELGEPFATAGMCLYRDGEDSVAWHGDRIGRSRERDTMIAIVSLGSARVLALRPRDGGSSTRVTLGHGDLIVMGGSCQRTWDHCVPKAKGVTSARISIQYRVRGVR